MSTQNEHPWRATARTTVAAAVALLPALPAITQAMGTESVPVVAAILTATAAITRILADPHIDTWLDRYGGRGSQPNPEGTQRMTEQTPATTATPTTEVEHFAAVPVESADPARRTITGIVVPYNENGVPRQNVVRMFRRGSLTLPAQIGRVKLYREHRRPDGTGEVVGHAIGFEETDDALRMTFKVVDGPDGDRALAEASSVRDGLSIEARNATNTGRLVTSADLEAVALVPIPAFDNARVETVVASKAAPTQEDTMTETITAAPEFDAVALADALAARLDFASAPRPVAPAPAALTVARAAELVHTMRAGTHGDADIAAALADITRSRTCSFCPTRGSASCGTACGISARSSPCSSRPLTHYNFKGWRWTSKPQVDDYTGNKTEIPTNAVGTAPVTGEAKRLAGGHDIDRKFWDFKDTEAITSYWDALTESYAIESDARAATFVTTSAKTTGLDGVTAIPAQADSCSALPPTARSSSSAAPERRQRSSSSTPTTRSTCSISHSSRSPNTLRCSSRRRASP